MARAAFRLRIGGEIEGCAHLGSDGGNHFRVATLEYRQQAVQVAEALLQGSGGISGESRFGGCHGGIGFGFTAHVDEGNDAFRGRVHHFEAGALDVGCDPLPVDIVLECIHVGARIRKGQMGEMPVARVWSCTMRRPAQK